MGTPPPQGTAPGQTGNYTPPTQPQPQQRYPSAPPTPPSRLTPERKRRRAGWLLLLPLALLLGGGIYLMLGGRFGFLGGSNNEPAAAITAFYSALDNGKCEDARATLASPDMTAQQLCDRWKALKDAGTTSNGAADTVSISGDTANVGWLMTAGGKPNNRTISLRKSDNTWKITNATSELLPAP